MTTDTKEDQENNEKLNQMLVEMAGETYDEHNSGFVKSGDTNTPKSVNKPKEYTVYKYSKGFQDFKVEILKKKNINCELRIMNNKLGSNIHDRWIISKDSSFNIPSPDTIARGQFSEIKSTPNRPPFEKWWDDSLDIITKWNEIEILLNKKN